MWIDSHCHLEPEDFRRPAAAAGEALDERPEVLARARAAGVGRLIVIGSGHGIAEIENALALAQAHPQLFAVIGVHPHDASIIEAPDAAPAAASASAPAAASVSSPIAALAGQEPGPAERERHGLRGAALWAHIEHLAATEPRVVAVGETGLDYFYKNAPPAHQQALLRRFIRLSTRIGKPLSLHIRDAHLDAQRIVREEGGAPAGGVIHCFTGGPDEARSWLALGFHISLSGIVTFKSAAAIQEAARLVPADRLLLETDCPYLAPVPLRGQRNEPAYLVHTAAFVARLRGVSLAELSAATRQATERLFKLPPCESVHRLAHADA